MQQLCHRVPRPPTLREIGYYIRVFLLSRLLVEAKVFCCRGQPYRFVGRAHRDQSLVLVEA